MDAELESFLTQIDDTKFSPSMSDRDILVYVLNNLLKEYYTILDDLQSRLIKSQLRTLKAGSGITLK